MNYFESVFIKCLLVIRLKKILYYFIVFFIIGLKRGEIMFSENVKKISMVEKVGYVFGDFVCNLIYVIVFIYFLFFYIDVFGLLVVIVGIMFLVVRIIDVFVDFFIGIIVDRMNSRFGCFRLYFLFGVFLFVILVIFCFIILDFLDMGKLLYVYMIYVGLLFIYIMINVLYGVLIFVMIRNN